MDRRIIIGVDCGVRGGIAFYEPKTKTVCAMSMPNNIGTEKETIKEIDSSLRIALCANPMLDSIVYVEDVPPYVGVNRPAARIFKLAKNYGIILGILTALETEYKTVRPQEWMKAIGTNKKKHYKTDNAWKNYLKKLAMIYYPVIQSINKRPKKPTLKTADALLILKYAMERERNGSRTV